MQHFNTTARLPSALTSIDNWLVWRLISRPGKKPLKMPYFTNGKLLNQVELLAVELSTLSANSEALNKLRSVSLATSQEQLHAIVTLGRTELAKLQEAASAAARRKAVLEGLQKLGYQVQEGLSTMATDSGRLIAHSPVNGDYGVELVTGANQKVQVRSIAFGAARDSSQDVAEERRWCGDFGKLQAALQAGGCEVVVEKALGIGTTPLRVIEAVEERRSSQTSPGAVGHTSRKS